MFKCSLLLRHSQLRCSFHRYPLKLTVQGCWKVLSPTRKEKSYSDPNRPSPDMLPFSLCNKKILAIRHMNDTIKSVLRHEEVGRAKDFLANLYFDTVQTSLTVTSSLMLMLIPMQFVSKRLWILLVRRSIQKKALKSRINISILNRFFSVFMIQFSCSVQIF